MRTQHTDPFYVLTAALQHRVIGAARASRARAPPCRLAGTRRHHRRRNDPASCTPHFTPCPGSTIRGRDRRPYWRARRGALLGGCRPISQSTQNVSFCLNQTATDSNTVDLGEACPRVTPSCGASRGLAVRADVHARTWFVVVAA